MIAIAAVSRNWGIGKDGDMLFHIPDDLKFFRETTLNKTVIMGRKTLESLPGGQPLDSRENIVISSKEGYAVPGAVTVSSIEAALAIAAQKPADDVFVIGGGVIYSQLIAYCSSALITHVSRTLDADTFFPNLDELPGWERVQGGSAKRYENLWFCHTIYSNSSPKSMTGATQI